MLVLDDVTLTYPDGTDRLTALDHVGLTVPDGTFAAVTGPSGSGKSSLLSVAATLVTPDSGSVRIGDSEVTGLSGREAARLRRSSLGIVFQTPNLLPSLTVREQLEIIGKMKGGTLHRLDRAARRQRIDTVLDEVGMLSMADRRPGQLSGGQRQRVNIARAIVQRPEVLLVDEPTSALDFERGTAIVELLGRLARDNGLATVLVTHELDHLRHVDEAYRMVDGRLTQIPRHEYAGA